MTRPVSVATVGPTPLRRSSASLAMAVATAGQVGALLRRGVGRGGAPMTRNLKRQWAEKRADGKRWYMGRVIRDFDRCPMPTCRSLDVTRWEDCARCNDCYTWIEYR